MVELGLLDSPFTKPISQAKPISLFVGKYARSAFLYRYRDDTKDYVGLCVKSSRIWVVLDCVAVTLGYGNCALTCDEVGRLRELRFSGRRRDVKQ
jgi:hypothetical protein